MEHESWTECLRLAWWVQLKPEAERRRMRGEQQRRTEEEAQQITGKRASKQATNAKGYNP